MTIHKSAPVNYSNDGKVSYPTPSTRGSSYRICIRRQISLFHWNFDPEYQRDAYSAAVKQSSTCTRKECTVADSLHRDVSIITTHAIHA